MESKEALFIRRCNERWISVKRSPTSYSYNLFIQVSDHNHTKTFNKVIEESSLEEADIDLLVDNIKKEFDYEIQYAIAKEMDNLVGGRL